MGTHMQAPASPAGGAVSTLQRRCWLAQAGRATLATAGTLVGLGGLALPARAADALRIGLSLPLSGERAAVGKALLAGAQAALAGAQWRSRPIELVALDDAGHPAQALKNTQTLAADPQVLALLGSVGQAASLAMLPALEASRLPLIGPVTGSESLRAAASPWVFPVRAGLQEEAARIVNQLDHQSLNDMAVVWGTDAWSREAETAIQLEMNRAIMRPVVGQRLAADLGNLDTVVSAVSEGQPQAVIVVAPTRQAAAFIRSWSASGYRASVAVFSETGLGLAPLLGELARGVAVCQVLPSPWRAARPLVRDYQNALRNIIPGSPLPAPAQLYGYASLEGYVAAGLLLKALPHTGSASPSREALAHALQSGGFDIDGTPLRFGPPPRRGSRFCEMTVLGADGVARS